MSDLKWEHNMLSGRCLNCGLQDPTNWRCKPASAPAAPAQADEPPPTRVACKAHDPVFHLDCDYCEREAERQREKLLAVPPSASPEPGAETPVSPRDLVVGATNERKFSPDDRPTSETPEGDAQGFEAHGSEVPEVSASGKLPGGAGRRDRNGEGVPLLQTRVVDPPSSPERERAQDELAEKIQMVRDAQKTAADFWKVETRTEAAGFYRGQAAAYGKVVEILERLAESRR